MTEWHKYPEEKPTESKAYWITVENRLGERRLDPAWFDESEWVYNLADDEKIIAWAELAFPEPYKD